MRALDFPPDALDLGEHDRYQHPCPQVQRRMELLRLAAHGLPRADLIRLTGLSRATVQRRLDDYRDGGLDAVRRWAYRGQPGGLARHATTLEEHSRLHPPATVADAADAIFRLTAVRRGPTQVRLFLKKVGARIPQGPGRPGQGRPGRPGAVPR
jgi:transposase